MSVEATASRCGLRGAESSSGPGGGHLPKPFPRNHLLQSCEGAGQGCSWQVKAPELG